MNIFAKVKKDLMETFSCNELTSFSSLVAIVIKGLGDENITKTIPQWYVMAMWSMRKQNLLDY